ncbi:hypothetical protein WN944_019139 [Citrus x changshan-huyou]|uniref:Reverse transcriptase Ty1/copia-type domain-containing protein n=1 Tax=Citrus x changshan-huyou TaxID=2935761 RepID=A0AAP0LUW6_9ROSI
MDSLHQMFGQNIHFARKAALKRITDTKMEEGTKVRDHVFKMMDYLNEEEQQQPADQHRIILEQPSLLEPRRSGRVTRLPARYMFLGETYMAISDEHVQDLTSYNEALIDRDVEFWKKAMNQEMESMYSNKVWELVEAPNGVKPIGCKWIYKRKSGVDGRVETFKARLVAEGYTQKEGIDYEETFSPDAMLKSIRILLSIAAVLDYEIWQMDVKTAFLNRHLKENIYMQQPDGFIQKGQEHMVCKLQRSIYRLKQASRSWNIIFDQAIKSLGFIQNIDEPCVYKKIQGKFVAFLVLCVDNILLIGNDIGVLTTIKIWLAKQFDMKDLGETSYILGIKLLRDRKNKTLVLSQAVYIDKILARFRMENSKTGLLPFRHGITFSKDQSPKTSEEIERMRQVPCAEVVGSLMYAMLCTRRDICFADSRKSTSGYVFVLGSGAISWRSVKQSYIADSTIEAEYVAASEAAKEAVWLSKFLQDLEVKSVNLLERKVYESNDGFKLDIQKAQFGVFALSSSPGVRQGDLLSPLLFCTAEEVLYGGILDLHFKGLLKPLSAPRICFLPTHTMLERKAIIYGSQGGVSTNSSSEYSTSQFPGTLLLITKTFITILVFGWVSGAAFDSGTR